MLILGIETSGLEGSVALWSNITCLGVRQLNRVGRRHAQSLVLEINELLNAHSFRPHDVQIVAVSRGPGSFTGLRVGMTCAKTFAYATRCRYFAVDTFLAIANNAPAAVDRLYVIEDAQRDELFAGEYVRDGSRHWKQASPIGIVSVDEFCRMRTDCDVVTGPGVLKIDAGNRGSSWLIDEPFRLARASVIAQIASIQMSSESSVIDSPDKDFWRSSPFYLRLSAAEEKRAASDKSDSSDGK